MIDIVMSVYNGDKYLEEMIDTILNQTYFNWRLIIRNNASIDNTKKIIKNYSNRHSNKIIMIDDNIHYKNVYLSFDRALVYSDSEYIMFADGDDVWLKDKIELSLNRIKHNEIVYGRDFPLLIHTDLIAVNEKLQILANSVRQYQKLNINNIGINRLLMQSVTYGNTFIFNKQLKLKATPIPEETEMHDIWFALVASAFGKIDYIDRQTIMYRQHGSNTCGTKKVNSKYIIDNFKHLKNIKERLSKKQLQAAVFLGRYRDQLDEKSIRLLSEFSNLSKKSFLGKRLSIIRNNFYMNGFERNVGLMMLI